MSSMAQSDRATRFTNLSIDTYSEQPPPSDDTEYSRLLNDGALYPTRPQYRGSATSEETIRATATPPVVIPGTRDEADEVAADAIEQSNDAMIEQYMRNRKPSITFNNEIVTECGHRQSMDEPLQKPHRRKSRGRSIAQALSETQRPARAQSESDRSHYDPVTGRHLPEYSTSPPQEEAHIGEPRFPLLQTTVDAMARESRTSMLHALSMVSDSTMSPTEEPKTPKDEGSDYLTSPISIQPSIRQLSSSYEAPRPGTHRKASQRWKEGETTPDFFGRAGSIRDGKRGAAKRGSRRDTNGSRSPRSAASSFLRGFSMSSGSDETTGPPSVDAEGQTIGDDYVLGKQIGYGGFSVIKEVTQLSPETGQQRKLAVKIVRRQIDGKTEAENDTVQSEFEHEVELWRFLNNRHILSLEAVYKMDEATFCFIPLNLGGTLFDLMRLNRQGLDPMLACNYSLQLAAALRYLHLDARVVHRDIKLENCLIDTSNGKPGLVRLCDFGMAEWISNDYGSDTNSLLDSPTNNTSSDDGNLDSYDRPLSKYFGPANSSTSAFAGGSLEYAAPEILRVASHSSGNIHDISSPEKFFVSPAVDIWAMGVCIFTMLMGRRPFADSFQPRIVMAILACDWDRDGCCDKAGLDASKVVEACLELDPTRRATVSEVMDMQWFDAIRGTELENEDTSKGGWRL